MKQTNKIDWVIISLAMIAVLSLAGMGISDYLSFLTEKQKREVVRTAIEKNWSAEQIQGLINSTQ